MFAQPPSPLSASSFIPASTLIFRDDLAPLSAPVGELELGVEGGEEAEALVVGERRGQDSPPNPVSEPEPEPGVIKVNIPSAARSARHGCVQETPRVVLAQPQPPTSTGVLEAAQGPSRSVSAQTQTRARTPPPPFNPVPEPPLALDAPTAGAPKPPTTTPTPTTTTTAAAATTRTPNVYINGLPAHMPEADLYALVCAFGAVTSVRALTRHVGERAS